MRRAHRWSWVVLWVALLGCDEDVPNVVPVARAEVAGEEPVSQGAYRVDFSGEDVVLTLDGSASTDPDGEIVAYVWMSGTRDPSGADGRYVAPGEPADWPADGATTKVALGEGRWAFHLYVRDDDGAVSDPATLRITVGNPPPIPTDDDAGTEDDGGTSSVDVATCTETVTGYGIVSEACAECVCGGSGRCAELAVSACNETCWGLVDCTVACATRDPVACVPAECGDFLAELGNALMLVDCTLPCQAACTAESP